VRRGRLLAGGGDRVGGVDGDAREADGGRLVVAAHQRDQPPLAGQVELEVGDVDDRGGVGVLRGGLGREAGVGSEALEPGGIRPLGGRVGAGGGVDGDVGVGDLLVVDGEDREAEAVIALWVNGAGGGDDEVAWFGVGEDLLGRSALRGGKFGRRRGRALVLGVGGVVAAGGHQRRDAGGSRGRRGETDGGSRHGAEC
jgi:hypothetical protein